MLPGDAEKALGTILFFIFASFALCLNKLHAEDSAKFSFPQAIEFSIGNK